MPAAHQVGLVSGSTGAVTFYEFYYDARTAASAGDTIQVWADLDEEILLKNNVNIWIAPGRKLNRTGMGATVTDGGSAVICSISGNGIITNTFVATQSRFECIKISNSDSEVIIECDEVIGLGKPGGTVHGPTVNIVSAAKFSLNCNIISNDYNSCVIVAACDDLLIECQKIESGFVGGNGGTPVVSTSCAGSINAQQIICNGHGSCLVHKSGILTAGILKITTKTSGTSAQPTVLVGQGSTTQILYLTFDEIQNLNASNGDAVKISEGTGNLTGRRIYSYKGFSLDLQGAAQINCSEIISDAKGINIDSSEFSRVEIDSELIEGSIGNYAVVFSSGSANYLIRNAKIRCTNTSSSSIGIYIYVYNITQNITLENVTVVTGNLENGDSIVGVIEVFEPIFIQNYGLFLNKESNNVDYKVGTDGNNKVIVDSNIT